MTTIRTESNVSLLFERMYFSHCNKCEASLSILQLLQVLQLLVRALPFAKYTCILLVSDVECAHVSEEWIGSIIPFVLRIANDCEVALQMHKTRRLSTELRL